MARREHYLFVCVNERRPDAPQGSCGARGSVAVHAALKSEIAARGLAATTLRACTSSCLDLCWAGPTIGVSPDGYFYGRVTVADVPAIVEGFVSGSRVERLVLPRDDFDASTARPPLGAPASGAGSGT